MENVHYLNEEHILIFLAQLSVLLGVAKVLGELGRKWGCPPLAGEILTGILLGPTIFGRFMPDLQAHLFPTGLVHQNMLETVSWLGVLFLLLVTGFEVNLSTVLKQGKAALILGIVGVIVPLTVGCAVFWWMPESYYGASATRLSFTLFLATAASISAITVIARVLHDLDVLRSDVGLTTLSGFVVNDLFGWLIFTVVLGLTAQGDGGMEGHGGSRSIVMVFVLILAFGVFCLTLGSRLVGALIRKLNRIPELPQPATTLALVAFLGLVCGAITQWIGMHAILGFFVAGIMAGNTADVSERSREIISQMIHAVFVPIFFASIGLKIDFLRELDLTMMVVFTAVAVGGKFVGAWLAAQISGFRKMDAMTIGIAFIPGGAMEIILGMLAIEFKLISQATFVAIVFAALMSSVAVGPLYAWALRRQPKEDIGDYVETGMVLLGLVGVDRWEAIPTLCATVPTKVCDVQTVTKAVLEREKLMGTGLEAAVAVPHARLPGLKKPVIGLGLSTNGIDWDCRDGKEVQFVFLVLTPEDAPGTQLLILGAIANAMTDEKVRTALLTAKSQKEASRVLRSALKS